MTLTKEQKQKIFNLFVETYDIHLMDDELNQIGNIVYLPGDVVRQGDVLLAEISGYVAMNDSKSKDISNMSFDGSLSRINRHWGDSQQIKRCKILISK